MKKKILSLLTAFAMVFGILVAPFTTASAADTVTVTPPTGVLSRDQLSDTKPTTTTVNLYKLTTKEDYAKGAPWEHTGGKIAPDGTTKNMYESLGKGVQALKGAQFTFYKITETDPVKAEKILALLDKNKEKFKTVDEMKELLTGGKGATGLEASEKDATLKEITAGQLAKATGTGLDSNGQTAATNDEGLATVELGDGYYWVIESKKPEKITGQIAVPFGLTLPLTNAYDVKEGQTVIAKAGTKYLKTLFIYPKNIETDKVKIDKNHATYDDTTKKWVDKDGNEVPSAQLGLDYEQYQREKKTISEELGKDRPFQSKTEIPRNYTFTEFSWSDIMSEGLTYKKGTLKVTMDYVDADGNKQEGKEFIDLTAQTKVNAGLVTEKNNGFDIKVIKAGDATNPQPNTYTATEKEAITNLIAYLKNGPVTFHFSYSAKVNNKAAVDKPQSNSITFEPGKPDEGGKPKSKEGKIQITKSWKKDNADVTPTAKDITYYLIDNKGETAASVTVKAGTQAGTKIDAGKGITFTVGANLGSGTFEGLAANEEYTIREAVDGYKPAYGDATTEGAITITNNDNPDVKKPSEPTVIFHGKKFVKMDQVGKETRLFGAEFVVRRAITGGYEYLVVKNDTQKVEEVQAVKDAKKNLDDKIAAYNALSAEEQKKQKTTYDTAIDDLQKKYNDAVIAERTQFDWVEGTGSKKDVPPTDAHKLVSDGQGRFEITGLKAGDYELQEITAPVGYALNEKGIKFNVKDGTYKGDKTKEIKYTVKDTDEGDTLAKDGYGQRVDNKKLTIPQTGGIGSLIFIVAGAAIMIGAFVAYKKSQAVEA